MEKQVYLAFWRHFTVPSVVENIRSYSPFIESEYGCNMLNICSSLGLKGGITGKVHVKKLQSDK